MTSYRTVRKLQNGWWINIWLVGNPSTRKELHCYRSSSTSKPSKEALELTNVPPLLLIPICKYMQQGAPKSNHIIRCIGEACDVSVKSDTKDMKTIRCGNCMFAWACVLAFALHPGLQDWNWKHKKSGKSLLNFRIFLAEGRAKEDICEQSKKPKQINISTEMRGVFI